MGFVQTLRNIGITETADNANLERQNIELFLQNISQVHKQYSRVSAEIKKIFIWKSTIQHF